MNGAECLIRSFVDAGVDVCFANPGTSEMHLVQAIDAVPEMRGVLSLFEGVCTGAADGYARMSGKPATTLLHLGPGLGNGIANLHNARRARSPIINMVGNHPLHHIPFDAPLTSDIDTLAANVSAWVKSDSDAGSLAADGMAARAAALTRRAGSAGQIATLIIPADACWNPGDVAAPLAPPAPRAVESEVIDRVAGQLTSRTLILLDGTGLSTDGAMAAARISLASGCQVSQCTFPARVDSGAGSARVGRLPYFPEQVLAALAGVERIVLAGSDAPVSFFGYPDTPSSLVPEGCEVVTLAAGDQDVVGALQALAEAIGASPDFATHELAVPELPAGRLSAGKVASILARRLPEGAIVCGDSGGGGAAYGPTQSSPPHTWLNITGGSIGQGGPVAVGAAVACPDRQVFALLGDGASMYTNQAFWTQAREGLNVITVVFANRKYGILETEYLRLGVNEVGERAASLFDLDRPSINFVDLAGSMGVPGRRARTAGEFDAALEAAMVEPGPCLIEASV